MGKKRNQPEVLSPDLPDTSKSEKEKKQPSEFSFFCRKTSDKSGNYHFSRDDGEEVCYTAAHHGTDPSRLSPPDAAEILRLLTPILSEKRQEAEN